ncbi:hypothetical protein SOCE26_037030 [Sorangium cellulosum]|uniref:Secreted protein n=1 Tax=Sorangium cellulosum TaxID=56 RepID=A0A2L0ESJ7_SORCE|nr:hypothetical protein [Sorangium cellulosum]AUX42273.1 hypothetical protein SOCE26_037030 [Sorangium cellulosum]
MVTASTSRRLTLTFPFLLAILIPACFGTSDSDGAPPGPAPHRGLLAGQQPARDVPPAPDLAYPGKGFIVHEWGTDTVVVGSDGSLQPGLHHEEEDLPAFVYDRLEAGSLEGSTSTSVNVKMETPVTYFYAEEPLKAYVQMAFPKGIFTQWYPAVHDFYPPIFAPDTVAGVTTYADPALDPEFPFGSPVCAEKYGAIANGSLEWGTIEILGRESDIPLPEAPLDRFTWAHARQVGANPLRVAGVPGATEAPQHERFLFYRGLGNFDLPVRVTAGTGGAISAENTLGEAIGTVFVLNVGASAGAFVAHPEGIASGGTLVERAPSLDGAPPLDEFVEALGASVIDALDATGLYHDEAVAMVNTWKRQWFRTPGVRVLYLAPESWTDTSIPLTVDPAPEDVVRVMMIRVEVLSPELEAADVDAARRLADPSTAGEAARHFDDLGRFAEPRLRRALALLGEPAYGEPHLARIAAAATPSAARE